MLEQDRVATAVFSRQEAGWIGHLVEEGETLHLPEIGLEPPLADLHEGMNLPGRCRGGRPGDRRRHLNGRSDVASITVGCE